MSDPLPIPTPAIKEVVEKISEVSKSENTDASKVMFYLGIGVIVAGAFILYKKAQEAKKLDSAAT